MGSITRVVGIVSGKGGVGKTTVAVNLGIAIAQEFGRDVTVVDANLTTSHLGLHLGMYYFPFTFDSVLSGKVGVKKAIYRHMSGLKILPLSLSLEDVSKVRLKKFEDVIDELRGLTKLVLIDSAPGFGREALTAMKVCDEFVIVANPEFTSITDVKKVLKVSSELGVKVLGIILNRVKFNPFELSKKEVEIETNCKVLGVIPESDVFKKSLFLRIPVVSLEPNGEISLRFKEIASKILRVSYSPPLTLSFFDRIKYSLKNFIFSSLSLVKRV